MTISFVRQSIADWVSTAPTHGSATSTSSATWAIEAVIGPGSPPV